MAELNTTDCLQGVDNTGVVPCFLDFKFPFGAIIGPKGDELDTTANGGDILATLTQKFYNPSKSARWYPLYNILAPTDQSQEKQVQTFAKGNSYVVVEKFNGWRMQWYEGAFNLMKSLRKFNGSNWDFMFLDDDPSGTKLLGTVGSTANNLRLIPSDGGRIWTDPWKVNTAEAITQYFTEFFFLQKYVTDLGAMLQVNFDFPTTLKGLINAKLSSPSANTTPGSFNVAITSDSGQDLAARYADVLNTPTLWSCKNTTTQAAITINSVTFVPGTSGGKGYFTLACTTTAPPYPTSGTVDINLVAPLALAAAGAELESTGLISIVKS